jgi:UDP-N-acetylmuramate--alanine ligase
MADRGRFELNGRRRIHLVGVGGSGMSGLAKLLVGLGHEVSGSDLKPSRVLDSLSDLGIETWVGHQPQRMEGIDLLVSSSAVPGSDPEVRAAADAGADVWQRPDLLEALTTDMPAVGFTGTHGKTTSTAMAVAALHALDLDPTYLVGGELVALNTGAHLGDRDLFVLEADEAFGTFRRLSLRGLAVTNIEADHLDYYGNVAALEEAFALVANRTAGPVVGCIDDPGVRRLAERASLIGFGTDPAAAWRITDQAHGYGDVRFTLTGPDVATAVRIPRPGEHNVRNAAGVLTLLGELGYDVATAAQGLARFAGVRRRFEVRGRIAGVTVVDDYAHHPTEIEATVAAGRLGGWDRVIVVFQPHRYTRTAELAPEFGRPLALADRVLVTDVYSAGEPPMPGVSGRLVVEAVAAAGGSVEYVPLLSDVPAMLKPQVREGDLVLLLGAGDITAYADDITAAVGG